MVEDYRTGHNPAMCRLLFLYCSLLFALPANAWNAAGHRLSAVIAWQHMAPETRVFVDHALRRHPDHGHWVEKSGTGEAMLVFAEAATWPDNIRHDPRFYDERREAPLTPVPGLPDNARHSDWHYVDIDTRGKRGNGQLDRQIGVLSQLLRSTERNDEIAWALPWLAHLIGDLHQPLHAGRVEDRGGNEVVLIDEEKPDRAPVRLHSWWDDLPGPGGLRGKRLIKRAGELIADHLPPPQDKPAQWLEESRQLTDDAYPKRQREGKLLADRGFKDAASEIATGRIIAAGYRLARQLDDIRAARVSRGTR